MKKNLFFCTIFIIFSTICFSQNSTHEKNILAFNINGVKLGDSFETFKNKMPNAYYQRTGDNYVKGYCVDWPLPNVDCEIFEFFDNKLFRIVCCYGDYTIEKLGGIGSMLGKFTDKYGKFEKINTVSAFYKGDKEFSSINKAVHFWADKNEYGKLTVYVFFEDTKINERMEQKRKENEDFGF